MEFKGLSLPRITRKKRTPGTVRLIMVILALLAQILFLAYFVDLLRQNALYFYFILEVVGAVVITLLVVKTRNSSYAIVWLIIILILPVFGYLLFFLWGNTGMTHKKSQRIRDSIVYGKQHLAQDPSIWADFVRTNPSRERIGTYLLQEGYPLYQHTQCEYFPQGELQFERLIADLQQAEKFIFLEYFIVDDGQLWQYLHRILCQKVQQGVEVRVLMDDLGSITKLPDTFAKELNAEGIKTIRFNPVHVNIFRLFINYRNHQKIAVIDGNIGYTGGTNIADEYANLIDRLGHWKDTAIRLEGDAVWSLTVTFLLMWDSEYNYHSDYQHYLPTVHSEKAGFFQPFSDGPVNNPKDTAADMYNQIIAGAHKYVYITTPYLVIDNAMKNVLCMAAKGGIDVRLVTPKIPDHWYVHMVTQSNYEDLLAAGARIFEYTPGFMHAKTILSDDDNCIMGSINMDYRSFYLHFENGVWICASPALQDIKADFMDMFSISEEIHYEDWKQRPLYTKLAQSVLRIFAPLM